MRKVTLMCGLLLATLWMQGCIAVRSEKKTVPPGPVVRTPAPRPAVPEDMTIREIDAVRTLSLERNRKERYMAFAGRADLEPQAQVYLVNTILKQLSLESSRLDVLKAMIANPSFSDAAKSVILDRLTVLSLESHRVEILELLSER